MGPTHDRFGLMKTVHQTVFIRLTYRVYRALGFCMWPLCVKVSHMWYRHTREEWQDVFWGCNLWYAYAVCEK